MSLLGKKKVGFVGGGKMAEAIFGGMLSSGLIAPDELYICALRDEHLKYLEDTYKVHTVKSNPQTNGGAKRLAEIVDVLILSTDPPAARGILEAVGEIADRRNIPLISIMGGVKLPLLESFIKTAPVVRVMPNTPMLVREGIAGIVRGNNAKDEDVALTEEIFSSVGLTYIVTEDQLDSLTGISGCGPAFAGVFLQALTDGGVMMGLSRKMSTELAAKTLMGTAKMVLEKGLHPEVLKDNVCTPGGGTIAGVKALEDGGLRSAVMTAVEKSVTKMKDVAKHV